LLTQTNWFQSAAVVTSNQASKSCMNLDLDVCTTTFPGLGGSCCPAHMAFQTYYGTFKVCNILISYQTMNILLLQLQLANMLSMIYTVRYYNSGASCKPWDHCCIQMRSQTTRDAPFAKQNAVKNGWRAFFRNALAIWHTSMTIK